MVANKIKMSSMFFTESKKYKISLAAFSSVFVYLFLLFFQPFGINNYRPDEKITLLLVFLLFVMAAIIFVMILICEFLIRSLLFKTATKISLSVWYLLEITLICSSTFLFYNILGGFHDFYTSSYLKHILELGFVLAFPFAATIFYFKHTTVLKKYMEVQSLSKDTDAMQEIVLLSGDYKNDQIALPLNSIVFIESEDNYVSLNYLEDQQLKKYLIRSTLSSLEQKLTPEFFLRCNRSFIANLMHLESFKQHQKKLTLKLKLVSNSIIVSKSHRTKILSFLEKQSI